MGTGIAWLVLGIVLGCSGEPEPLDAGTFYERLDAAAEAPDDVATAVERVLRAELPAIVGEDPENPEFAPLSIDGPIRLERDDVALAAVSFVGGGSATSWGVLLVRRDGVWAVRQHVALGVMCFMPLKPVEVGETLFPRAGCIQCHPPDADGPNGPTLRGMFGSERRLSDGSTVVADAAYVRRVLTDGERPTLAGWAPTMPTYRGRFKKAEIEGLIAYLETLE